MEILILGAGLAGACAALALRRLGHAVTLVERRSAPDRLGGGVVLWPNAGLVLARLGLLDEVRAGAGTPPWMVRMDASGAPLTRLDIGALDRAMGCASHAILRRDLQAILLAHAQRLGVTLRGGVRALALRRAGAGRAQVHFDDGGVAGADLIVGADGRMQSVAGQYVHGAVAPLYQGFVNWVGSLEAAPDLLGDLLDDSLDPLAVRDYWGVGRRFGIVPVGRRKLYWAAAVAEAAPGAAGRADAKAELDELFGAWPQPVGRILAHSRSAAIRRIPLYDLEPKPCWQRDNVLLIGDAAHASLPTSGQGAGQALEDAWHLAQCLPLTTRRRDLACALARFTRARFEKTSAITHAGRALAHALFQLDGEGSRVRDAQARGADPRQMVAAMARGWGAGLDLAPPPGADAAQ